MTSRERAALAEAIEHCAMHNREYQHVTPATKLTEWRAVLGDAIAASQLDAAVTQGEIDASEPPTAFRAPPSLLAGAAVGPPFESMAGPATSFGALPSVSTALSEHRRRTIDALLTAIDRALEGERHSETELRIGQIVEAIRKLAGAPL